MALYRSILVAVDGSPGADEALDHAVELARDQHARLEVITVVPPLKGTAMLAAGSAELDLRTSFDATLRAARDRVPDDIGLTTRLLSGPAAQRIVEAAAEGSHDLVVLGSHGHGRWHEALLGHVSARVAQDCPVPVLLVGARTPALIGGPDMARSDVKSPY